nr:ATP-binding protein [Stutzerimonas nitrititolerans]
MPDGGSLSIRLGRQEAGARDTGELTRGSCVRLEITDSGCGMREEVRERAFEPFFTTKPVGEGTGLGLAQVYGFARQSHGTVSIDSEIDQGTRITLLCRSQTRTPKLPNWNTRYRGRWKGPPEYCWSTTMQRCGMSWARCSKSWAMRSTSRMMLRRPLPGWRLLTSRA